MNSENSNPSEPYTFIINLTDRINLKRYLTNTLLYQSLAYITHGEILEKFYKSNRFKISTSTWNNEFELLDGSYFLRDVKYCFEYIIKLN